MATIEVITHLESDDLTKLCEISEELDDDDVHQTIRRLIRTEWLRLTPLQADAAINNHGDSPEQTAAPLKHGS